MKTKITKTSQPSAAGFLIAYQLLLGYETNYNFRRFSIEDNTMYDLAQMAEFLQYETEKLLNTNNDLKEVFDKTQQTFTAYKEAKTKAFEVAMQAMEDLDKSASRKETIKKCDECLGELVEKMATHNQALTAYIEIAKNLIPQQSNNTDIQN